MPGGFSKRLSAPINSGDYRTRFFVYGAAVGVDDTGGVIRNPAGIGKLAGGAEPAAEKLWLDYGAVVPYGGSDRAQAAREVTSLLWTVECRWGRSKPYTAGMLIFLPSTGESFQINSVEIVDTRFRKTILTCRVVA